MNMVLVALASCQRSGQQNGLTSLSSPDPTVASGIAEVFDIMNM
ncbi:MAG: hypothetical protein WAU17_05430 [Nitrospirales bacterium]